MATGIRYCLKHRLSIVLDFRKPIFPREPRMPSIPRTELPTLTGIPVSRTIGQLARDCRTKDR
jgi:hypothetical protein